MSHVMNHVMVGARRPDQWQTAGPGRRATAGGASLVPSDVSDATQIRFACAAQPVFSLVARVRRRRGARRKLRAGGGTLRQVLIERLVGRSRNSGPWPGCNRSTAKWAARAFIARLCVHAGGSSYRRKRGHRRGITANLGGGKDLLTACAAGPDQRAFL